MSICTKARAVIPIQSPFMSLQSCKLDIEIAVNRASILPTFSIMVRTRTHDHGATNTKAQTAPRRDIKNSTAKDKKTAPKLKSAQKRDHDTDGPKSEKNDNDEKGDARAPVSKKAKHSDEATTPQANEAEVASTATAGVDSKKLQDIISRYGALPLSDIGLSKATEATPETILAFVLNAMLTSARISHELAYKSAKCLIEAGYHDVHTLKKSSWEERTEVLTKGGYTRYREKTATALGELADFVLDGYGRWFSFSTVTMDYSSFYSCPCAEYFHTSSCMTTFPILTTILLATTALLLTAPLQREI